MCSHTTTITILPAPGITTSRATLINEFRFTYSRRQALSISAGANTTLASQIGIQGTNASFFPTVTLSGLAGFGNTTQQERLQTPINSNQYVDNLSLQRGNHQFKFGGELRTSNNTDNYFPTAGGSFAFTNTGVSTNAALGSLANLLLGRVNSATLQQAETLLTTTLFLGFLCAGRLASKAQPDPEHWVTVRSRRAARGRT